MPELVESQPAPITQEDVDLAESQEQAEMNIVTKTYLNRRVVTLRAQNNHLRREVEMLREELEQLRPAPEEDPEPK